MSFVSRKGTFSGMRRVSPCSISLVRGMPCEETYSAKHNPKVDLHDLSRDRVDHDIRQMPVADSQDVTDHRAYGDAPRVSQAHHEPRHGVLVLLGEEVAHDRLEALDVLLVPLNDQTALRVDVLHVHQALSEIIALHVFRAIPMGEAHQSGSLRTARNE